MSAVKAALAWQVRAVMPPPTVTIELGRPSRLRAVLRLVRRIFRNRTAIATLAIVALLGASAASAQTCGSADNPCRPSGPPPTLSDQQIAIAMQQEIIALHGVMIQMLLTQQDILNTLRQIQAAQASGGSK